MNPKWRLWQQGARKGKRSKNLTLNSDLKPKRRNRKLTRRSCPLATLGSGQQHEPIHIGDSSTLKENSIAASKTLPTDSKGAINTTMKAIEGFKGLALRSRAGLWVSTEAQQIPTLLQTKSEQDSECPSTSEQFEQLWERVSAHKRFKEDSWYGGSQERAGKARRQGSGGLGSKGFMVKCSRIGQGRRAIDSGN